MLSIDPDRLARRQLKIDRERTARFDSLENHKRARMVASPLSFLRGSAALFYEIIACHPGISAGPPGEGWIVGDAHIENFGAYRADALSLRPANATPEKIAFDLNDFDDALIGPWRLDVLRLTTSLVLGGRENGASGTTTLAMCDTLVDAYVGAAFAEELRRAGGSRGPNGSPANRGQAAPPPSNAVNALIMQVRSRTRKELLDARTTIARGRRQFIRGARYRSLSPKLRAKAERAFAKYAARLPDAERPPEEALEVLDAAFRVAGTGSLGCLRIAVLVRGRGGDDGAWIFDMKEEGTPSATRLVRPPRLDPAERVHAALVACIARPPRMIGATRLRGSSMFVRRLAPQEDKIDFAGLPPGEVGPLAGHLGALLGAAHRRGATRVPKKPWDAERRQHLVSSALALAGAHEAIYLAYCDLVRRSADGRGAAKAG
jgi:uncharacterized protein (DUF2252 family)